MSVRLSLRPNMSLPVRERGLKFRDCFVQTWETLSLPVRERGLKFGFQLVIIGVIMSLPVRERGLKCLGVII